MFKLSKKREIRLPVVIPVPQDEGRIMKYEAMATFEILPTPEHDAVYAAGGTDLDLLNRAVTGWGEDQFQDDEGKPLLYNEQSKAALFGVSYVRSAFIDAYMRAYSGREGARKN